MSWPRNEPMFCLPKTEVDRSGINRYIILIRGPEDPDRAPRWSERDEDDRGERPVDDARKRTKMDRAAARAELYADIKANPCTTFNATCVRRFGTTADVTNEDVEDALWSLVEDGSVVHTMDAPIRWAVTEQVHVIDGAAA